MSEDPYQYDRWIADALRGVLRRILSKVEAEGLHGDHHYYITVDTRHPDVEMPGFLRVQYPKEITLVLQHQFRDLLVTRRAFEVVLSFSGKSHRLRVPFDSVLAFADPSVNFGLKVAEAPAGAVAPVMRDADTEAPVPPERLEIAEPESEALIRPLAVPVAIDLDETGDDDLLGADEDETSADEDDDATAEVITLDAFRNKK